MIGVRGKRTLSGETKMIDHIGVEEVFTHEPIEDVKEMRPTAPIDLPRDFYAGLALRDNYTREMAGLDHWQADFPNVIPDQSEIPKMSLRELLDLIQ
jgi:hypothetical protein